MFCLKNLSSKIEKTLEIFFERMEITPSIQTISNKIEFTDGPNDYELHVLLYRKNKEHRTELRITGSEETKWVLSRKSD